MWKELVILNGTIVDEKGKEVDEGKLFKLLADNGYEYGGLCVKVKSEDIDEAVTLISDFINEDILKIMLKDLVNHYGELNNEDIEQFFTTNTGTAVFDDLMHSVLTYELKGVYKKYTTTDWKVSDEFGGRLGESIANKIKHYSEE